ncbi:DnaJ domain [Dillenia turbinata]|uniref:DnaJ domain n=1 Tax=Dillenia turbinata TaxID=194707 RepID=A0AAN8Z0F6_9MAGN
MDGRAEAERWLLIAEKLLAARDLLGSKSFAIRARESDPRLEEPYQILAVVDTLLAASHPINNTLYDWYGILQLHSRTQDFELISQSYRRLAFLLNPNKNRFSFSDQALQLVIEAWNVLSDPFKKSLYDNEITRAASSSSSFVQGLQNHQNQAEFNFQQQHQGQQQQQHHQELQNQEQERREREREESERKARENERIRVLEEQQRREREKQREGSSSKSIKIVKEGLSFWTACPYCYNLYEYGKEYEECCLRCQNCERAFHAVRVPNPIPEDGVVGEYFCCWGFFPLGFDSAGYRKGKNLSNWSPITQMFSCPIQGGGGFGNVGQKKRPKVVIIDDDGMDFPEQSDDDDDYDWNSTRDKINKKKQPKNGSGRGRGRPPGSKNVSKENVVEKSNVGNEGGTVQENVGSSEVQDGVVGREKELRRELRSDTVRKGNVTGSSKGQTGKSSKDVGKLDLNVEFSNEVEEPTRRVREGHGPGHGEEDGIEGIGFFEGLDEFLSSLPILSVVGDDKSKAS